MRNEHKRLGGLQWRSPNFEGSFRRTMTSLGVVVTCFAVFSFSHASGNMDLAHGAVGGTLLTLAEFGHQAFRTLYKT